MFCCEVRSLRTAYACKQRALEDSSIRVRYDLSARLASFQKLLRISITMRLSMTTDNCAFGKYVNCLVYVFFSIFSPNNSPKFAFFQQIYKWPFLRPFWFPWTYLKYIFAFLFRAHVFVTKITTSLVRINHCVIEDTNTNNLQLRPLLCSSP